MDGRIFRFRLPAEEGAGHVGAVPVLAAAHVDHDAVALFQRRVVRLVVGIRGVGAEGDDGTEGQTFAARVPVQL